MFHNPGAGPGAAARGIAGGLRLVTEGYIRLPPLPPTHLLLTSYLPLPDSGSPPVYDYRCNLQFICVRRSKNIVFYRVSWPSPSPDFILATLKTMGFSWFWVFGRGPERKIGHLDGLGVNMGLTWCQD